MDQLLGHEMKTEYRKGYAAGYGDTVQAISEHWVACQCGHAKRLSNISGSSSADFRLFKLEHQVQVLAQSE